MLIKNLIQQNDKIFKKTDTVYAVIFYAHMCTFLNKINGIVHITGMDYVWICINNKLQELFSLYIVLCGCLFDEF